MRELLIDVEEKLRHNYLENKTNGTHHWKVFLFVRVLRKR